MVAAIKGTFYGARRRTADRAASYGAGAASNWPPAINKSGTAAPRSKSSRPASSSTQEEKRCNSTPVEAEEATAPTDKRSRQTTTPASTITTGASARHPPPTIRASGSTHSSNSIINHSNKFRIRVLVARRPPRSAARSSAQMTIRRLKIAMAAVKRKGELRSTGRIRGVCRRARW